MGDGAVGCAGRADGAALLSLLTSTAESLESVVFELVVPSALSVSLIAVLVCACCAAVA